MKKSNNNICYAVSKFMMIVKMIWIVKSLLLRFWDIVFNFLCHINNLFYFPKKTEQNC